MPKALIVARYFAGEQAAMIALEAELESDRRGIGRAGRGSTAARKASSPRLEKVNRANVTARLTRGQGDQQHPTTMPATEAAVLDKWLSLEQSRGRAEEAAPGRRGRPGRQSLAKYPTLTEAEIKTLVVDDKWLAALAAAIHGEMDRISQALTPAREGAGRTLRDAAAASHHRVAEMEAKGGRAFGEDGVHCLNHGLDGLPDDTDSPARHRIHYPMNDLSNPRQSVIQTAMRTIAMTEKMKYADITEKIIGAAFEVHKFLGNGFQEVIYQRALAYEMRRAGLEFAREIEQEIYYRICLNRSARAGPISWWKARSWLS